MELNDQRHSRENREVDMGRAHESISIARDGVNAELTSSSCSGGRTRHAVALAKAGSPADLQRQPRQGMAETEGQAPRARGERARAASEFQSPTVDINSKEIALPSSRIPKPIGLRSRLWLSAQVVKLSLITSSDASTHFR